MGAPHTLADAGLTLTADLRVLVIGTIGAGNLTSFPTLSQHPSPSKHTPSTIADGRTVHQHGQERRRPENIPSGLREESGVFECTGAGPLTSELNRSQAQIRLIASCAYTHPLKFAWNVCLLGVIGRPIRLPPCRIQF